MFVDLAEKKEGEVAEATPDVGAEAWIQAQFLKMFTQEAEVPQEATSDAGASISCTEAWIQAQFLKMFTEGQGVLLKQVWDKAFFFYHPANETRLPTREKWIEVRRLLCKARERLAIPGVWVNHAPHSDPNKDCSQTALVRYAPSQQVLEAALELLLAVIWTKSVPQWNDAKGRQLPEVLAAFDKAIEIATRKYL